VECEAFVAMRLRSENATDLVEEATETHSRGKGFQPTHGPGPLFHAAMILLHMMIQVTVRPVHDLTPEDVAYGTRVGIMATRGHALGDHPRHRPRRAEEGLGCRGIPCVAEPDIHSSAIPINRPIAILPLALHTHVGFVYLPTFPHGPRALLAEGLDQHGGSRRLPITHGFMSSDKLLPKKHLRQVPQAQLVAEAPRHHQADHIGGISVEYWSRL
jgi:hypothetical protein